MKKLLSDVTHPVPIFVHLHDPSIMSLSRILSTVETSPVTVNPPSPLYHSKTYTRLPSPLYQGLPPRVTITGLTDFPTVKVVDFTLLTLI